MGALFFIQFIHLSIHPFIHLSAPQSSRRIAASRADLAAEGTSPGVGTAWRRGVAGAHPLRRPSPRGALRRSASAARTAHSPCSVGGRASNDELAEEEEEEEPDETEDGPQPLLQHSVAAPRN